MKKMKILLLLPLLLLSSACSTGKEIESSTLFSSSDSVIITSSSEDSASSERKYEDVDWSDETFENIQAILGEYVIPYFKTRTHSSKIGVEQDVRYVDITCYDVNVDTAEEEFKELLIVAGYKITSKDDHYVGYVEKNATDNVYIQFAVENGNLRILGYIITERTVTWPKEIIYAICGGNVPEVKATSYDLSIGVATNGNSSVYGYCYGVSNIIAIEYGTLLQQNGFTITDIGDVYVAENGISKVQIMYYVEADGSLYIRMFSSIIKTSFPSAEVENILGEELPVCEFEGVEYLKKIVPLEDGYEVYTIFCDNASMENFENYKTLLLNNGWELMEFENEGTPYYYFEKENDCGKHEIQISYSYSYKSIAIALYK